MPKREIIPHKTPMAEQPPQVRKNNYEEVTLGYTIEDAIAEAQRCLDCPKPLCIEGCPVRIDIPNFIKQIAEGNFQAAVDIIKESNALPAITGRVCPQETQCEKVCVMGKKYEPVGIGRLERFVADWEASQSGPATHAPIEPKNKKVAVVGSGPAGLTVAFDLARQGYGVTVFEALHEPGGVLVYGIPEFRLPKSIVKREVDYVRSLGVEIETDYIIGRTEHIDDLLERFDAVFLGTGAGLPWFLGIPGEDLGGIYSSNEYLTRANLMRAYRFPEYSTPIARGKRVLTIGGGNTAMDAARTALRLGAEESHIVYRRSKEELPARQEEIHHALQEGVIFDMLTTPVAFHGTDGRVTCLECQQNELGEPDASGRRRPIPKTGSNFNIEADVVVIAISSSPSPIIAQTTPELETGKGGIIVADPQTMKTSKKGVFAGGDIVTGGATVILAMGQARVAAQAIKEYLETGVW